MQFWHVCFAPIILTPLSRSTWTQKQRASRHKLWRSSIWTPPTIILWLSSNPTMVSDPRFVFHCHHHFFLAEKRVFNETEVNIPTTLSLNGRIFISHSDHLDALTTLMEQEGPSLGSIHNLDSFSSHEIAYFLSHRSWKLFNNIHPFEFIFHTFGRHNFTGITANLDLFLRHYAELQYWACSEVLLEKSLSRRVQILKKCIKIAG